MDVGLEHITLTGIAELLRVMKLLANQRLERFQSAWKRSNISGPKDWYARGVAKGTRHAAACGSNMIWMFRSQ